ncbi:MAG TPA: phosphatase domain-containing protein, partial [Polyangiales bacterium]
MGRGAGPAQPDLAAPTSLWRRLARRWRDPVIVLPYLGYGTPRRLTVRGRVLEDEGFAPAADGDTRWRNLVSFYKRLESDEVPGARLRARGQEALTDAEGYFRLELDSKAKPGWQQVEVELLHPGNAKAVACVLVPSRRARFGVISDIDDTVVRSNVTSKLRMILTVALSNARTRMPFPGVAAFYRALQKGTGASPFNPVFYVSSSPWNLHDVLTDFLTIQKIPLGPLMLRDWGLTTEGVVPGSNAEHKLDAIRRILGMFPALPFLLIGDSGQEDPEIYHQVVREHPDRIRAVYIRNV